MKKPPDAGPGAGFGRGAQKRADQLVVVRLFLISA